MVSFDDRNGKPWHLDITYGTIRRVKAELKIDLCDLTEKGITEVERLILDPFKFGQILWMLCGEQAAKEGLDEEAFADCYDGEAWEKAAMAFHEELANFSPSPARRKAMKKVHQKSREIASLIGQRAEAKLDAMDLEKEADKLWTAAEAKAEARKTSIN